MKRSVERGNVDVVMAERAGILPNANEMECEICGNPAKIKHHDDYREPLEVVYMCHPCHRKRHVQLGWGIGGRNQPSSNKLPVALSNGRGPKIVYRYICPPLVDPSAPPEVPCVVDKPTRSAEITAELLPPHLKSVLALIKAGCETSEQVYRRTPERRSITRQAINKRLEQLRTFGFLTRVRLGKFITYSIPK